MSDSLITKRAIGTALKKLCVSKPFHKITVSDITDSCGLNRQSFYYHFQDKFELLNWVYYDEAFSKVIEEITLENWNQRMLLLLQIMKQDQGFYTATIKDQEKNFSEYLFKIARTLFLEAIASLDRKESLTEEHKSFYAEFLAHGLTGTVVTWARRGMKESPEHISSLLQSMVETSEKAAYDRYMGMGR